MLVLVVRGILEPLEETQTRTWLINKSRCWRPTLCPRPLYTGVGLHFTTSNHRGCNYLCQTNCGNVFDHQIFLWFHMLECLMFHEVIWYKFINLKCLLMALKLAHQQFLHTIYLLLVSLYDSNRDDCCYFIFIILCFFLFYFFYHFIIFKYFY